MVSTMDMSAPVTRGELREELDRAFEVRLAPFATKVELAQLATKAELESLVTKEYLEERLEPLVTKEYLEERLEPLVTKEYLEEHLEERLEPLATKKDLETWGGALLEELKKRIAEGLKGGLTEIKEALSTELGKHVKSMEETFAKQVSAFDDKYKELPWRVNRLEGAVFPDGKPEGKPAEKSDDNKERPEEPKAKAPPGEKKTRSSTSARSPKRR
jgi:hypothetical protein